MGFFDDVDVKALRQEHIQIAGNQAKAEQERINSGRSMLPAMAIEFTHKMAEINKLETRWAGFWWICGAPFCATTKSRGSDDWGTSWVLFASTRGQYCRQMINTGHEYLERASLNWVLESFDINRSWSQRLLKTKGIVLTTRGSVPGRGGRHNLIVHLLRQVAE